MELLISDLKKEKQWFMLSFNNSFYHSEIFLLQDNWNAGQQSCWALPSRNAGWSTHWSGYSEGVPNIARADRPTKGGVHKSAGDGWVGAVWNKTGPCWMWIPIQVIFISTLKILQPNNQWWTLTLILILN